jgi:hypothetical protein
VKLKDWFRKNLRYTPPGICRRRVAKDVYCSVAVDVDGMEKLKSGLPRVDIWRVRETYFGISPLLFGKMLSYPVLGVKSECARRQYLCMWLKSRVCWMV